MRKVTAFHLDGCPYCANAFKALDELKASDAKYGTVEIEWIEESKNPEVAEKYDYFAVPSMFIDSEKLYEARKGEKYESCLANVKRVLDEALN